MSRSEQFQAVWMDQGGTFTDVVRVDAAGRLHASKVLSDRADLHALAEGVDDVRRGSTVATNALLERRGAPVLLLTTVGFADLPWIGDQTRPDLFALRIERPEPLCSAVVEVQGRIGADGSVLSPARVDGAALASIRAQGIDSVAVVLVHGPLAPGEEERLERVCRDSGFGRVSLGHRVAPSRGFLARLHTTLADAALGPLLPRAPGLYMRSDGGLARHDEWRGCDAVLSGPAGGVVAVAELARAAGLPQVFGLDMGGTSTDVCRVRGEPERTDHLEVAGLRLRVPAVDLVTVAAGGGSILSVEAGVYRVGPRSAGADPGPACYGRGGPATVTDCEAVLDQLAGFPPCCGPERNLPLDLEAARRALEALDPGRPVEEVALGFRTVAAEAMARAVRGLAAGKGVDPADHALVAFGGAGPGHACGVARRLGIQDVLVPTHAGLFSAVGIGLARRRAERVAIVFEGDVARARRQAVAELPFAGQVEVALAMRHAGTAELIEVADEGDFAAAHRRRFGFDRPGLGTEVVEVRARVTELAERALPAQRVERAPVRGPACLSLDGATLVVDDGWEASFEAGFVRLVDHGPRAAALSIAFHPVHTAVFGTRVMAIAEQMGERLARLARSVSIRQRRDFSCAVFDARGRLVANAPHVPVHLGAMGATVRDLLARRGDAVLPGTVWASNDPYAGGSHLPDITVMAPLFSAGRRLAFVACRGHHVDVGGTMPGSMPQSSTRIEQEGLLLSQVRLAVDGLFEPPDLSASRQPDEVRADLEAQVAACTLGLDALGALARDLGEHSFCAQLDHLLNHGEQAVGDVLARLQGEHAACETLDDGTELSVRLSVHGRRAQVVLLGPPHPGNLNAPEAVARAALLYAFRCLVDQPVPLNEGALRPFDLLLQPGGLFDPKPPAAVAGGNVETSQRLVDALLAAVGALAPSQGTMNNLTVGMDGGAWYETIGGGSGAGPGFRGAHAVQVHMTNTRATDIEELEARFAVRLESWRRRRHSGGPGRWPGGDGVVKQWLFLAPARVCLLAGRRVRGAPGAAGGGPGLPGRDECDRGAGWTDMPSEWMAGAGDRLRISTPGGGGWGDPDHALVALGIPLDAGEQGLTGEDGDWLLAEPVGPAS